MFPVSPYFFNTSITVLKLWRFSALVGVSEEVKSRCHIKHALPRAMSDSVSQENFPCENAQGSNTQQPSVTAQSNVSRRQKSWDLLDQSALAQARIKQPASTQAQHQVRFFLLYLHFK